MDFDASKREGQDALPFTEARTPFASSDALPAEVGEDAMTGTGYLIVRATTARGAIPLESARVTVRNRLPEFEEGRGDAILSAVTDRSGSTARLSLPAPPKADSVTPGNAKPYASYDIEVFLDGYYQHRYYGIPIFDGITAVQQADLIPLPDNAFPDGITPDGTLYFRTDESQAPLL